ncbi:MAG: hypothetical protein JSV61_04480, partial [Anaerolineales bacterium]
KKYCHLGDCTFPWGGIFDVYLYENLAYIANYEAGLRVLDVSDPANPVEVGYFDTPGELYEVYAVRHKIYAGGYESGFFIFSYWTDEIFLPIVTR